MYSSGIAEENSFILPRSRANQLMVGDTQGDKIRWINVGLTVDQR